MNNGKWYRLKFKQIQPIHIGKGSHYGIINETRIFIPGWTMWGALTKAYNLKNERDLSNNQKEFENISCFYPYFKKGNNENNNVLFPEFKNGEFYLGDYSESEFRAKFVDTFTSTAIDPTTNTALDKSLHELNIILPSVKADYYEEDKPYEKQLYWVGIVKLNNEKSLEENMEIYIGGNIKYGLGKLILEEIEEEKKEEEWMIKNEVLRNYYPFYNKDNPYNDETKIELLVEIEKSWESNELKVKLMNNNGLFYVPGIKKKSVERKGNKFEIIKGYISLT